MARDWRFAPASFDGIPFYVDQAELEQARRIVTHEYPGAETHDNEDLGLHATRYELTAYFVSETADIELQVFASRLRTEGPGLLILPMFGAMRVRAHRWRTGWNQQKLNYVGVTVTFIEEASTASLTAPAGLGNAQLAELARALPVILGGVIAGTFVSQPLSGYFRADGARALDDLGAMIETVRAGSILPATIASTTQQALAASRAMLTSGPCLTPDVPAQAMLVHLDRIVTEQTGDVMSGAFSGALTGAAGVALLSYAALLDKQGVSPLISIVPLVGAAAFTTQAARVLATADYTDRAAAIAARQAIAVLTDQMTSVYSPLGSEATEAIDALLGKAAMRVSSQIASLAPVVLVSVNLSMPANVLAWRIYGNPDRSQEIVARNRIATPCFMPLQFEASAT